MCCSFRNVKVLIQSLNGFFPDDSLLTFWPSFFLTEQFWVNHLHLFRQFCLNLPGQVMKQRRTDCKGAGPQWPPTESYIDIWHMNLLCSARMYDILVVCAYHVTALAPSLFSPSTKPDSDRMRIFCVMKHANLWGPPESTHHKNIAVSLHKCSAGKWYSGPEPLTTPKSMAAIKLHCLAHLPHAIPPSPGSQQSVLLDESGSHVQAWMRTQRTISADRRITWVTFTDVIIKMLSQPGWRSIKVPKH